MNNDDAPDQALSDDEARRALFPDVGVLKFDKETTWSFNTNGWPRVPLMVVTAACQRSRLLLKEDEVQELCMFLGDLQRRIDEVS